MQSSAGLSLCAGCLAGSVPSTPCVYPSPLNISFVPTKSYSSERQLRKTRQLSAFIWRGPAQPTFWPQVEASSATFWGDNVFHTSPAVLGALL